MNLVRRGRMIGVSGFLLGGAIGIISSTQTWLTVERADAGAEILVPGASALPLLAPLSLAVLALGAALSITGPVLRVVFGVLAAVVSILLGWSTLQLMFGDPIGAVTATVTEITGLAGESAMHDVVASIAVSPWASIALVGWALLLVSAVLTVATGRRWMSGGRRYRTDAVPQEHVGPVDAVDSWDELSRGTDPTR